MDEWNTDKELGDSVPNPQVQIQPKQRGNWMGKTALILSVLALIISCISLFFSHPISFFEPKEEDGQQTDSTPMLTYRNQQLPILEGVAVNRYNRDNFEINDQGWLLYEHNGKRAAVGIDVSVYQGEIDWQQVADAGVEFAMIRVGYRGYGKGTIMMDKNFEQNMQGALDAGLDVGVYFFSQAINVWEAEEEADFILEAIRGYEITYPIAFDWESIAPGNDARTDGMTAEEITRCAGAFCDIIEDEGYQPLIYFNQDQGYLFYQLEKLTDYPFWLAEYNARPSFFYHFDLWQYTHSATVPGIEGNVDMNLAFRTFGAEK